MPVNQFSRRRALWLVITLVWLALYFILNKIEKSGYELILPIDRSIPLFPPAIIPYLFGILTFVIVPFLSAIFVRKGEFEAFTVSVLLAAAISYIAYIIFPTFVLRPEVTGHDIFSKAISMLYRIDRPFNAVPSGHTFYTLIFMLFLWRWKPASRAVWGVLALAVISSTLFTRQHNIIDVGAGFVLGIAAYFLGRLIQKRWQLEFASK